MRFERLKLLAGTLRFRMMLWTTLIVAFMVISTIVIVREVVRRTLFYEFDNVLVADLREIGQILQKKWPAERMVRELEDYAARTHVYSGWFLQIFNSEGRILWESDEVPFPTKSITPDSGTIKIAEQGNFRSITALVHERGGPNAWYVQVGCSIRSVKDDVHLLDRIMLLAGLLMLFLAPLGAYAQASRATMPLTRIIGTAARLQPSKLDERLPVRGANDELDQLSVTINGMLDRIASYLARNRDFIANAAHELRSPLTAIRSSVEVTLNRDRTSEEYQHILGDVMEECTRLSTLVNRLLLLAEGDAGRLRLTEQQVRFDKVLLESIDMFQVVAEAKEVELHVGQLDAPLVPGDEIHLRQVVRNLIDNAIKFTPANGRVELDLHVDGDGRWAELRVKDSGIGIRAEDLPRIFERFYQVDKSRQRDQGPMGYGLGLSICQTIVQNLGGEILVQSKPGQGSIFRLRLPVVQLSVAVAG